MAKDQPISLQPDNDVQASLEWTANGVATRELTTKQGDVINTTCKMRVNLQALHLKYLQFLHDLYAFRTRRGDEAYDPEAIFKRLPPFFGAKKGEAVPLPDPPSQ